MSLLELAIAKDHLGITADVDDDALQRTIDAAEAIIAGRIGALEPAEYTERVPGCGRRTLALSHAPVIDLVSVVPVNSSALTTSDLYVTDGGIIEWESGYGCFDAGRYTVTYEAGYENPPADLMQAIVEMVRHLWQSRRGRIQQRGANNDGDAMAPGYLIPNRVAALLQPYERPGIA